MTPHETRLQLLKAGYLPVPLRGKRALIKGWTKARIDETWLEQHAATGANTGVRCDNLVVFDIDSEALAGTIQGWVEDTFDFMPAVRGRPNSERRALVFRNVGVVPFRRSAKYVDQLGREHVIERLTGSRHQLAAIGVHPSGAPYTWPKPLPLWEHLPVLSEGVADQIFDWCEQALDAKTLSEGWAVASSRSVGGSDAEPILTLDMEFTALGGCPGAPDGPVTVADAREWLLEAGTDAYINCHLDGVRASSDSGAGRMRVDASGVFLLADFAHRKMFSLAPEVARRLSDGADDMLADSAPAQLALKPTTTVPAKAEALAALVADWVYVAADNTCSRVARPNIAIPMVGFRNLHPGLGNAWLHFQDTKRVECRALLPDQPPGVVLVDEETSTLNTYVAPSFPEGGSSRVFFKFLRHLLPHREECELFLSWLATKVAKPWLRLHGLVMVAAARQGTGRGTLIQIMSKLLGEGYTASVDIDTLLGRTYQSQYTDFLADNLLVVVEEARDSGGIGARFNDWNARKTAYERLKALVDPTGKTAHIVRKGQQNTQQRVFCSFFIATNHSDALAIEPGDRRFIVLRNGLPLSDNPDLMHEIHAWVNHPENIGALKRDLLSGLSEGVAYDPFGMPPETPGKVAMVQENQSEIDEVIVDLLTAMRERGVRMVSGEQVLNWVRLHVEAVPANAARAVGAVMDTQAVRVQNVTGKPLRLSRRERKYNRNFFSVWSLAPVAAAQTTPDAAWKILERADEALKKLLRERADSETG